ncbi:FixH family protein [bacterium]|nr:MAG: FixH family protein [bacterium]
MFTKFGLPFFFVSILVCLMFLTGCSDDKQATKLQLLKIADVTVDSAETIVSLYAEDSLQVGYNRVYFSMKTTDDGHEVDDAHIMLLPMMDMTDMGMMHSSPYEMPSEELIDGYFQGALVFTMPSYDEGHWTLTVTFHNYHNNKEGSAVFDLMIKNSTDVKALTVGADKYIVTLIDMKEPQVGLNDFEIGLYKKQTMMSFPPVTSASVSIEPTMPSMGHGSSNNVNPVHTVMGRYLGKVNFTMTGDWQVDVNAAINDTTMLSTHYGLTVE